MSLEARLTGGHMVVMVTEKFSFTLKTHYATGPWRTAEMASPYLVNTATLCHFSAICFNYRTLRFSHVTHPQPTISPLLCLAPFSLTTTAPAADTAGQKLSGRCQQDLSPKCCSSVYFALVVGGHMLIGQPWMGRLKNSMGATSSYLREKESLSSSYRVPWGKVPLILSGGFINHMLIGTISLCSIP